METLNTSLTLLNPTFSSNLSNPALFKRPFLAQPLDPIPLPTSQVGLQGPVKPLPSDLGLDSSSLQNQNLFKPISSPAMLTDPTGYIPPCSNSNILCNQSKSLSSLSLRKLRRKFSKKAKRIPVNCDPASTNDRLIIFSDSTAISRADSGEDNCSVNNNPPVPIATMTPDTQLISVDANLIKDIANLVSKSLDGKFQTIFSNLKVVSEAMGVDIPFEDETFVANASLVIEGHAKAFDDI